MACGCFPFDFSLMHCTITEQFFFARDENYVVQLATQYIYMKNMFSTLHLWETVGFSRIDLGFFCVIPIKGEKKGVCYIAILEIRIAVRGVVFLHFFLCNIFNLFFPPKNASSLKSVFFSPEIKALAIPNHVPVY